MSNPTKLNLLDAVNVAYRNRVESRMKAVYPDVNMSEVQICNDEILALIEVLEKVLCQKK